MEELGFSQSLHDGQRTYAVVYVDDLHIVGPDLSLINKLKAQLASKFKTTGLPPLIT